jgi:hypothetical protein
MAVRKFHSEHGVWQRLDYRALDFDRFFLRRRTLRRFLGFLASAVGAASAASAARHYCTSFMRPFLPSDGI